MKTAFIILCILCLAAAIVWVLGYSFVRAFIRRQDDLPSPETGGECSSLLAPTGEALWEHNIPYFEPFRALPFETLEILSSDGLRLRADLLRGEGDTGVTVIFCHGYKSEPAFDFAAMYDFYRSLGYNLMYLHMRAHGESEGKYIGFGALDRYDVVLWAKKAAELFPGSSIFLHGMSMGAASILQCADLGLPGNVRGIIADCGYSCIDEVFRNLVGRMYHLPATPFVNIFELINLITAGYGFRDGDSVRSMQRSKLPLLYICGDSDLYVPADMAMRIFDACAAEKELLLVPGAGHAASYMLEKKKYQNAVRGFIAKHRRDI